MLVSALRTSGWLGSWRLAVCGVLALAGVACGQSVTTSHVDIGGLGARTCSTPMFDPPTLDNGTTIAKGSVNFSYNSITHYLTLQVQNLTPEVWNQATPVIREIYFNLPQGGTIGSASLEGQSATGMVQPTWQLQVDANPGDGAGSLVAGCFGRFAIKLKDPGTIDGSIAANADVLPGTPGSMVQGVVTFILHVNPTGTGASSLRASTFTDAISYPDTTMDPQQAYVVFRFEGAPGQGANGYVTERPLGGPAGPASGWVIGNTNPGSTVSFASGGTPGFHTLLVISTDPGPTPYGGVYYPIGEIHYIIINGVLPPSGWTSVPVTIPLTLPEVTMVPVYGLVVNSDFTFRVVSVSEQFTLEVDF